jgi:hypothetical protein
MSLRMLTNVRLADLRLTTAQQRTTGQNLPSEVYRQPLRPAQLRIQWVPVDCACFSHPSTARVVTDNTGDCGIGMYWQ